MRRLLVVLGATIAVLLPAAAANAATQPPPSHPCSVSAHLVGTSPTQVTITDVDTDCIAPLVTVQEWLAPSADGRPIAEQQLWATGFDGLLQPGTSVQVYLQGGDNTHDSCFMQIDVAYGHARDDLTTPYGSDLIDAWHTGTQNCFWVPPTSPPATEPPDASAPPVTTTPPASSPPVTTPPPATTVPPVTTPPAPSATPTPTVTLVPPTTTHKPTPPVVTHKPKPKPRPSKTHKPVPTPKPAPTTTKPPTLPFTGSPGWLPWAAVGGGALVCIGFLLLLVAGAGPRHTH